MVAIFIAAYLTLTSFYLPLPVGVGMTSLADYGTSFPRLISALVIALAAAVAASTRLANSVLLGLFVAATLNVAPLVYSLAFGRDASNQTLLSLSGKNDIIVLSFDGIQQDAFAKAMQHHPERANRLRDFTYFSNVISSSPATHASITGELAGNRNFKQQAKTTEDLIALAKEKGVPTKLTSAGYRVSGYGVYATMMQPEQNLGTALVSGDPRAELVYLFQMALSRSLSPRVVASRTSQRTLRSFVNLLPISWQVDRDSLAPRIDKHVGPEWDRSLLKSWDDFQVYHDLVRLGGDTPAAQFLHFTFTHHPVDFDADCTFLSDDKKLFDAAQTYDGLVEESGCALLSMDRILARLEEIGAFDNNLIVVKSDHGAPVQWNNPSALEGKRIHDNPDWGYGRYKPILMVKLPKQRNAEMIKDERPAIIDDLALSLCHWVNAGSCDEYTGMDLFDPKGTVPSQYFMNIVSSPQSNFKFDTHETISLSRSADPLKELDSALR